MHKGSCICEKVRFEVEGDLMPLHACHCSICRKGSGHFGAGTDIPLESLTIFCEELGYGRAIEHEVKIKTLIDQLKALGVAIRQERHEKIVSVKKVVVSESGVQLA